MRADEYVENAMIFLQKWRVKLGHLFTLVLLFCAAPRGIAVLAAGTAVALLGEAIRIAAAGLIRKDESLSRSGLYGFVRNPLYVGSFLMYLGFCIASGNVWVTAASFPFFFIVYLATILREEEFLRGKFGAEFEKFTAEVPRFLPRPTRAPGATRAQFSWKQAAANKEYEGAFATVLVLALLWGMWFAKFYPLAALLKKLHG